MSKNVRIGKRLLCLLLSLAMILSLSACDMGPDYAERPRKTESEATATPTAAEVTPTPADVTPTETPVSPTDVPVSPTDVPVSPTDAPVSPTDTPVSPTVTPVTPTGTPGGFTAPEKGCSIDFPTRELYHYDMDLALDTANHTIGGHVVFRFYNDSADTWNELCLRDYSSLFIDSETAGYDAWIVTDGATTEITNIIDGRDNSELSIRRDTDVTVVWLALAQPLAPNESMTLSYDFTATIPLIADRYGLSEGVYNVTNFYPILAEYDGGAWSHAAYYQDGECFFSEVSDYDVRLSVPKDFIVASTGTEAAKTESGEQMIYTYKAPCVRDFVFSASENFVLTDGTYNGVHVNVLYNRASQPEDDMTGAVKASLKAAEDSLEAFGQAFGRYPYEELDIILAPIAAGGMEYPNLVIIEDSLCASYYQNYLGRKYRYLETTIAHEIGHQWFMGIVGSNSGMQPWQDESITSYTELVYDEYIGLISHYAEIYSRASWDISDPDYAADLTERGFYPLNRSYYEFISSDVYVTAIYSVGQQVLYQMEEIIGREQLHSVLREYVHRNAFKNADPMSFFEVLFECCGRDNAELNALVNAAFVMPESMK